MNSKWKSMFRSLCLDHLRQDDDGVDRLSRLYSVASLVASALTVGAIQFFGRPITCWCPAQFTDSHRDYADAICWVSNTYFLPMEETVPGEMFGAEARTVSVSYFRWVPLILVLQGVLVYLPHLLWRSYGRLNVKAVMDVAKACSEATDLKTRGKNLELIVHLMHWYLLPRQEYLTGCSAPLAKPLAMVRRMLCGNHCLNFRYMVVKLLYLANAIGQVFFIGSFLSSDYHMYGIHMVERLMRGLDWGYAERLPRVTLCAFEIRHQSRVHSYVLQCALTINLFNEKLFVFLWFWFVFIAFITAVNFLRWLFRSLYWPGHVQYVRKQIRVMDATPREAGTLAKFAENYLRRDGMFIVRLIGMNMGEAVAGEVVCGLRSRYNENGESASHANEMKQRTTNSGGRSDEEKRV